MSNSQSGTSPELLGHEDEPNLHTPEDETDDGSSDSSSSSESESEPEEQGSGEDDNEPASSQLHIQEAEGPVRSGSFVSHAAPQEKYKPSQTF